MYFFDCFFHVPPCDVFSVFCERTVKSAIRECERTVGVVGASHSESIPQSVCVPLTQCSLWTLSAVLFLPSQITAFQADSSLWQSKQAREVQNTGQEIYRTRPLQNVKKESCEVHNTYAHTTSNSLRSAHFTFCWHFFQMSNHSPGTSYTDLQGSSLRMSNQTVNLYKALDRVQCPLASHGEAWGEEVTDAGLRWLPRCTRVHFLFCLLNNPAVFISWKFLMTLFPVQPGLILYVYILQNRTVFWGGKKDRHPTNAIKREAVFTAIIWALSHVYF